MIKLFTAGVIRACWFQQRSCHWVLHVEDLSKLLVWNKLALVFSDLKVLFLDVTGDTLHNSGFSKLGVLLNTRNFERSLPMKVESVDAFPKGSACMFLNSLLRDLRFSWIDFTAFLCRKFIVETLVEKIERLT